MLILNEKEYAKNIYDAKNNSVKSVTAKVGYITRYHLYEFGYDDKDNYRETVNWMNKYHINFDESCYSKLVADAVKKAHKKPFFFMDHIVITKSELDTIASLNNLRAEKVLFVLLCMAKQQRVVYGFTNGLVKYSLPNLCKMARISVPTGDREYILYHIIQSGFLSYPKKNDTSCLMVNFLDDDNDAEIVVNEIDCQELAYVYLNWKNRGDGYARCEFCGRLMKKSKKSGNRFCRTCSEMFGDVPDGIKPVVCRNCGQVVYVSKLDTETCRCEECREIHLKKLKSEQNKRYYQLKNSVGRL